MKATVSNRTGKEVSYGGVKIPANGRTNIRTSLIKDEERSQLEKDGFTIIQDGNGDHLLVDAKAHKAAEEEAKAKAEAEEKVRLEAEAKAKEEACEALKAEATELGIEFDGRTNQNTLQKKVDEAKAKGDK